MGPSYAHTWVPPPPLAEERPAVAPGDVVLPWNTILLGLLAGFLALMPWTLWLTRGRAGHLIYWVPDLVASALCAGALALGVTACDRLRWWPRALRWALGMGAAGVVPAGVIVSTALRYGYTPRAPSASPLVLYALVEALFAMAAGALLGAVLGLAAARGRRLFLYLACAGCAYGLALRAALLLVPLVWTPSTLLDSQCWGALLGAPLASSAQSYSLLWVILPLALAERLWAARRKAGLSSETEPQAPVLHPDSLRRQRAFAVLGLAALVVGVGLFYSLYYKPRVIDRRALRWAVMFGNVAEVRKVLDQAVDADVCDFYGTTALHWAAALGKPDAAKVLLEAGADPNRRRRETGETPLHEATQSADPQLVELLLDHGADPNAKCKAVVLLPAEVGNGVTPLHMAAYDGHAQVILALVRHGARINQPTSDGITPLQMAAPGGSRDLIDLLLKRGADANAPDRDGYTALHGAAYYDNVPAARRLLEAGADLRAGMNGVGTPLHSAAYNGGPDMVRLLLKHKAVVEARDYRKRTPLYAAASAGNVAAARVLLEAGADVTAQADGGWTPLGAANYYHHSAVVQLLREHGANQ